jgi:putative transposase
MSKAMAATISECIGYTGNLSCKPSKRLVREKPEPLVVPEGINHTRSMDFMHDQLSDGRSYRVFNVIDDYNRGGLVLKLSYPCSHLESLATWIRSPSGVVGHV